jgi:hypothetical protein
MRHKKCTKTSAIIITDEPAAKLAINETVRSIGAAYEFHLLETASISVVEFFLGPNLPAAERSLMIGEIYDAFDSALQRIEAS